MTSCDLPLNAVPMRARATAALLDNGPIFQTENPRALFIAAQGSLIGDLANQVAQTEIEVLMRYHVNAGIALTDTEPIEIVAFDVDLIGTPDAAFFLSLHLNTHVSTVALTQRDEIAERVAWLDAGADDCLTVPFPAVELASRLRAAARRHRRGQAGERRVLEMGALRLSRDTWTADFNGVPVDLTTYEFVLLWTLALHRGKPLTREQLLDLAKGSAETAFDRSIDVQISRLRAKLGDDPRHPRILKTVRGVGYLLAL